MKRILLILMLAPMISFSQTSNEGDSTSSILKFILDIKICDVESEAIIQNAEITLLCTDGSSETFISNDKGKYSIPLKQDLSYTIVVTHPDYYTSHGRETTIGLKNSTRLMHTFRLQPMITIHEFFYRIDFDSTFSFDEIDFGKDTIRLYERNEIKPLEESSFLLTKSAVKNEYLIIRPNQFNSDTSNVLIELIDTSQIQVTYENIKTEHFLIGYSNNNKFWYELQREN